MSSDIDELMNRDPLDLKNEDIETIIRYHRQQRGAFDQGKKPEKKEEHTVDLSSVMAALTPPQIPIKRRSLK